jgi:hypothetical protein
MAAGPLATYPVLDTCHAAVMPHLKQGTLKLTGKSLMALIQNGDKFDALQ